MTDETYVLLHKRRSVSHPARSHMQKTKTVNPQNGQIPPSYSTTVEGNHGKVSNKDGSINSNSNDRSNNDNKTEHWVSNSNNNHNISVGSSKPNRTHHQNHLSETYWTETDGAVKDTDSNERPDFVPSLDLTCFTFDEVESNHNDRKLAESNSNSNNNNTKGGINHTVEDPLFIWKQRPSFVFPCEKSLTDYDGIQTKPPHTVYQDPVSTSPYVQMRRSVSHDGVPVNNHSSSNRGHENDKHSKREERTIHFTLSNPKLGKYLLHEEPTASLQVTELNSRTGKVESEKRQETIVQTPDKKAKDADGATHVNTEHRVKCSKEADNLQEIIDIVVVNGHLKNDTDGQVSDLPIDLVGADNDLKLEDIVSAKGKPKPRVTFSFHDDIHSSRSLKRYTPVKSNVKPLQGVLKKRQEPTQIGQDTDDFSSEASKHEYFKDTGTVFRTNPKSEYHEQGIPVKHIHSTSTDLATEARRTKTSTTVVSGKPPVHGSNRISLFAAERSTVSNNNIPLTSGLTYVCSNARGRMAYFRPSDGPRSKNDLKTRSKSAEDINAGDGRYQLHQGKISNARPGPPFTLRRRATSEQSLVVTNKRPMKPKIAFGSFILPKETTPRVKTAQVKFQDLETPQVSLGPCIHTNTRNSPYAAPSHILYREDQKHHVSRSVRRPYTAQTKPQQQQQKVQQNHTIQLAQRHSAPSTYDLTRDRRWRASRQTITIDNSPHASQQQTGASIAPKRTSGGSNACLGHDILPNKVKIETDARACGTSSDQPGKPGSESQHQRPDIATLNMMANKAKGASQYRFLTTLNKMSANSGALT